MSASEVTDLAPSLARGDDAPAIRPSYMTGFDGMATAPFDEKIRAVLAEPPPPEAVEVKPNGIVFLPGVYWRRQLTRAFGAGGWALAPRGPARVMGNLVVWPGALYCLGRFVADAVGECAYIASNNQMSYASAVEGAKTDCLSRCSKDLGMGTQLWDKAWRDDWLENYAEKGSDGKWRHRSGRPIQDVDLMAGAGGSVRSAPASAPAATPKAAPPAAPSGDSPLGSAGSVTSTAIAPAASHGPTDSGEAALDEQKVTIRAEVKRLGWKGHFAKMWLKGLFEVDSPDALTKDQAVNATLLLEHWGKDSYKPLLEDMRKDGLVRAEQS